MTKKDFSLIARVLDDSRQDFSGSQPHLDALNFLANTLSNMFERYDDFSRDAFLDACGEDERMVEVYQGADDLWWFRLWKDNAWHIGARRYTTERRAREAAIRLRNIGKEKP
jgi:hypothetical protein